MPSATTETAAPAPPAPAVTFSPMPAAMEVEAKVVEISDGKITADTSTFVVGVPYRLRIVNVGREEHSLELRDSPRGQGPPRVVFRLDDPPLRPGESRDLYVQFVVPGPYLMVCPLEGHDASGETLEIAVP